MEETSLVRSIPSLLTDIVDIVLRWQITFFRLIRPSHISMGLNSMSQCENRAQFRILHFLATLRLIISRGDESVTVNNTGVKSRIHLSQLVFLTFLPLKVRKSITWFPMPVFKSLYSHTTMLGFNMNKNKVLRCNVVWEWHISLQIQPRRRTGTTTRKTITDTD